jgi:hypothetical protein
VFSVFLLLRDPLYTGRGVGRGRLNPEDSGGGSTSTVLNFGPTMSISWKSIEDRRGIYCTDC